MLPSLTISLLIALYLIYKLAKPAIPRLSDTHHINHLELEIAEQMSYQSMLQAKYTAIVSTFDRAHFEQKLMQNLSYQANRIEAKYKQTMIDEPSKRMIHDSRNALLQAVIDKLSIDEPSLEACL